MIPLPRITSIILQRLPDMQLVHHGTRKFYSRLGLSLEFLCSSLRAQRGYTLQSPFLIRQALEQLIAIDCDLLLPPAFILLPKEPSFGSFGSDAIYVVSLPGQTTSLLAIDEALSRGYREEEQPHRRANLDELRDAVRNLVSHRPTGFKTHRGGCVLESRDSYHRILDS